MGRRSNQVWAARRAGDRVKPKTVTDRIEQERRRALFSKHRKFQRKGGHPS